MSRPFVDFDMLARATSDTRTFKGCEIIFKEGDPGIEFFVVKAGSVAVRRGNRTLQVLHPGEIFGEMALIDSEPRSATVIAETESVVVPVARPVTRPSVPAEFEIVATLGCEEDHRTSEFMLRDDPSL